MGLLLHTGFIQLQQVEATLWLQCAVFSLQWLLLLQSTSPRAHGLSSCSSQVREHRLDSWATQAYLLWGTWNPPGEGIKPTLPSLAAWFFTTEPPGKPSTHDFFKSLRRLEIEVNFFNFIKSIFEKPTTSIIPNGEKLSLFPSKIRNKMRMFTLTFQHFIGGPRWSGAIRKENEIKIIVIGKEEIKLP